ncbi:hypothetical protein [Bradyrhizobium sp.]|uniref:hypothetical protein n=1 Tax=Bradyrhizobium sp. TaxID=376 RepID=UPI003C3F400F
MKRYGEHHPRKARQMICRVTLGLIALGEIVVRLFFSGGAALSAVGDPNGIGGLY